VGEVPQEMEEATQARPAGMSITVAVTREPTARLGRPAPITRREGTEEAEGQAGLKGIMAGRVEMAAMVAEGRQEAARTVQEGRGATAVVQTVTVTAGRQPMAVPGRPGRMPLQLLPLHRQHTTNITFQQDKVPTAQ